MTRPHRRAATPATGEPSSEPSSEQGSATIWMLMLATVAILLTILLVDGGAKMQANEQAAWQAGEAARYAVNAVGPRPSRDAATVAAEAARSYLNAAGVTGNVRVQSPYEITVEATSSTTGPLTGVRFTATHSATAYLLVGVEEGLTP